MPIYLFIYLFIKKFIEYSYQNEPELTKAITIRPNNSVYFETASIKTDRPILLVNNFNADHDE